ncbi:hypothetical protein HOY82DRAFT_568109 [Tuber indicum]|nr:hypothetical protein HOY82DRAFT_568109 [Tuber indicum]
MKVAIASVFLIVLQLRAAVAGPLQNNPALKPREDFSLLSNQPPTTTKSFSRIVASKPPVTSVPSSASIAEPSSSLRLPVGTRTTSVSSSSIASTTTIVPGTRSFRRPPKDTPGPSQGTPVPSASASSAPGSSVPVSSGATSAPDSSVPVSSGSSTFTSSRRFVRPTQPQPQPPSSSDEKPSPPATVTATVTVTASAQPPPPTTPTTSAAPTTSQPANRPPSGTQPPPSANNNNTALAIALNKKFAALTASSPCDPKNPAQLHACIAGDFHTCGSDGKYAKVVDCAAPLECFALPLEQSTGASVACIAPTDAALRMGFEGEGELEGALGKRSISNQT